MQEFLEALWYWLKARDRYEVAQFENTESLSDASSELRYNLDDVVEAYKNLTKGEKPKTI